MSCSVPGRIVPLVLVLACAQARVQSSPSISPAVDHPAGSRAQPSQEAPANSAIASAAARDDVPIDAVATLTRWTLLRRVLPDGELTKGGQEVLVVDRNGIAEIHDGDAAGPVIKRVTVDKKIVAKLDSIVTRPDWKSLPREGGTGVPDGPVDDIGANGRHVKRFDNTTDEPIFREARAVLNAIWELADR